MAVKEPKSWAETNGTGDRNGFLAIGGVAGWVIANAGTLAIMALCPVIAIYLAFTITQLDGQILAFASLIRQGGVRALWDLWPRPSADAWLHIGVFGALEAALQLALPGSTFRGPVSPKGNVPVYKANGVQAHLTTLALFFGGWKLGLFDPARVYDLFGEILAALSLFSLLFCLFLYIKGWVAPSSSDSGSTGSLIFDYYWGMELYPRLGKHFDLKTWTNCRMGMMAWSILPLCFAAKQIQRDGALADSLLVSVALMQAYVFKFFWRAFCSCLKQSITQSASSSSRWETGYWRTMDIAHDRAGYYLCWGCLVWVPSVYTSPALLLAARPTHLGGPLAAALFAAGIAAIFINYDSDRQRQVFRATDGKTRVWGRPPKIIHAKYATSDGGEATSLLLASGWWGLARHFHYTPEILAAFFWTAPAGFARPLAYFYVLFLTILLLDRSFRDDVRCASKYGAHWRRYCKAVPYRMVPFVF